MAPTAALPDWLASAVASTLALAAPLAVPDGEDERPVHRMGVRRDHPPGDHVGALGGGSPGARWPRHGCRRPGGGCPRCRPVARWDPAPAVNRSRSRPARRSGGRPGSVAPAGPRTAPDWWTPAGRAHLPARRCRRAAWPRPRIRGAVFGAASSGAPTDSGCQHRSTRRSPTIVRRPGHGWSTDAALSSLGIQFGIDATRGLILATHPYDDDGDHGQRHQTVADDPHDGATDVEVTDQRRTPGPVSAQVGGEHLVVRRQQDQPTEGVDRDGQHQVHEPEAGVSGCRVGSMATTGRQKR